MFSCRERTVRLYCRHALAHILDAAPGMLGHQAPAAAAASAEGAPAPGKGEKGPPPKKEIEVADVKLVSFPEGAKFNVLREVRKLKPGMNLMDVRPPLCQAFSLIVASRRSSWRTYRKSWPRRYPRRS